MAAVSVGIYDNHGLMAGFSFVYDSGWRRRKVVVRKGQVVVVFPRQQVSVFWFRLLVEVRVISRDNRKASLFVVCREVC
jgi:hypothetical protein